MLRRFMPHLDNLMMAVLIWICTLPLVGLFILPFFGLKISLIAALGLLIAVLIICYGICNWKTFHS